jgi:hypothetical protein
MKDLKERAERYYDAIPKHLQCYPIVMMAGFAVQELAREWVPVSERLPESNTVVLCQLRDGGCFVCNSWTKACDQDEVWFADRFIAWMPLPEPYKELT